MTAQKIIYTAWQNTPKPVDEYEADRDYTVGQCSLCPPSWKSCNQKICYIPEVKINDI